MKIGYKLTFKKMFRAVLKRIAKDQYFVTKKPIPRYVPLQ